MAFARDGRHVASGSKDKAARVYYESSPGQWSARLLLSNSRSLSFLNATITGVRASAANKIVLEQHGAAASDGRRSGDDSDFDATSTVHRGGDGTGDRGRGTGGATATSASRGGPTAGE